MTAETVCRHDWNHFIEYGKIGWEQLHRYEGDEERKRYREMWQISSCAKCGETRREADRYYGNDMDRLMSSAPRHLREA
jgi:hypothetical protein